MKRVRLQQWGGQLLSSKARQCCRQQHVDKSRAAGNVRLLSTRSAEEKVEDDIVKLQHPSSSKSSKPRSPSSSNAATSAKLAALHARLSLPEKLPLQTLSRTLVDLTADQAAGHNNASLAQVGQSLLSYHVSEWLITTYPRLPMAVLFSSISAYIGTATLSKIAQEWGVESAAYPGPEVDPGLLQYNRMDPGTKIQQGASVRPDALPTFRRGISSRVVYDDEFGDTISKGPSAASERTKDDAYTSFVRAVVGSIYLHAGAAAAKSFITAHVLSRHLPMDRLFEIRQPTRDLSRLCAREGFEQPVARLLSETGRLSRHPVFLVGIFSGGDKLGEGSGPSLDEARMRAAIAALKAWYLYSPTAGKTGRVPSDVDNGGEWKAVHIDIGEIVS